MTTMPSLYNHGVQNDEDFIASFVARQDVVATLLRRLRSTEPASGDRHQIIIGPRGMGKTSLLRRLSIAIDQEEDLAAQFAPLTFREEQYNVLTLGDFWRNCGESLAEWLEKHGDIKRAHRIDREMMGKKWEGDENAYDAFAEELRDLGRRAVLLVDNLDLILSALNPKAHWTLRGHLQDREGPILFGAATQHLKQTTNAKAAFYEFFQPHYLKPLGQRETEQCMREFAKLRGDAGAHVTTVLDTQPERLRTLHTLTGGNPRVLALIYRLLETADSDAAMADLEILLDQVTPYYKARVEEFATSQQRAIIDAIALHWDPVSVRTLSDVTGIRATTLSAPLKKLRNDGLVEEVASSGSSKSYQIAERFLNIWYLMRHGTRRAKQAMRWLVKFLASFYSAKDLDSIARKADASGLRASWHPDFASAFEEAMASHPDRITTEISENGEGDLLDMIGELVSAAFDRHHEKRYEESIQIIDEIIAKLKINNIDHDKTLTLLKASSLINLKRYEESIELFDSIYRNIDDIDDDNTMKNLAIFFGQYSSALGALNKSDYAIHITDKLIDKILLNKKNDYKNELVDLANHKSALLRRMGREEDLIQFALNFIDQVGEIDGIYNDYDFIKIYGELALSYRNIQDYDKSIIYLLLFLEKAGDKSDISNLALSHAMLTDNYRNIKDIESANIHNYRFLEIYNNNRSQISSNTAELGLTNSAILHVNISDFNSAEIHLMEAIERQPEPIDNINKENRIALLNYLLSIQSKLGKFEAVIQNAEAAEQIAKTLPKESDQRRNPYRLLLVANALIDNRGDTSSARPLLLEAAKSDSLTAIANLTWIEILENNLDEVGRLKQRLNELPDHGMLLIESAISIANDNFGAASDQLLEALRTESEPSGWDFRDDLNRLLRLFEQKGYGQRLLDWMTETGVADEVAPVYAAFNAYVGGERLLLDVNPEVRGPAQVIYDRLSAPRRYQEAQSGKAPVKKSKRSKKT